MRQMPFHDSYPCLVTALGDGGEPWDRARTGELAVKTHGRRPSGLFRV